MTEVMHCSFWDQNERLLGGSTKNVAHIPATQEDLLDAAVAALSVYAATVYNRVIIKGGNISGSVAYVQIGQKNKFPISDVVNHARSNWQYKKLLRTILRVFPELGQIQAGPDSSKARGNMLKRILAWRPGKKTP